MGISEKEIEEYVKALGKEPGEHSSIVAVTMPSVLSNVVFGPMSILTDMKYNIFHKAKNGYMIIAIDSFTGKLRPEHIWLEKENIKNLQFKKKWISYRLIVEVQEGKLVYRVNKVTAGAKWQKENVLRLVNQE